MLAIAAGATRSITMECCTHCVHLISAKKRTGQLYKLEFSGDQREVGPHILLCWFFPPSRHFVSRPQLHPQAGAVFSIPDIGGQAPSRRRAPMRQFELASDPTGPRQTPTPLHTLTQDGIKQRASTSTANPRRRAPRCGDCALSTSDDGYRLRFGCLPRSWQTSRSRYYDRSRVRVGNKRCSRQVSSFGSPEKARPDAQRTRRDFGNRNGFGSRAGAGSGLRSKFPSLPANLRPRWRQHRLQLYNTGSVQCFGLGPRGTMLHQSFFCERARARGLSAASPRLLKPIL